MKHEGTDEDFDSKNTQNHTAGVDNIHGENLLLIF